VYKLQISCVLFKVLLRGQKINLPNTGKLSPSVTLMIYHYFYVDTCHSIFIFFFLVILERNKAIRAEEKKWPSLYFLIKRKDFLLNLYHIYEYWCRVRLTLTNAVHSLSFVSSLGATMYVFLPILSFVKEYNKGQHFDSNYSR
jgi:hypothetical protein